MRTLPCLLAASAIVFVAGAGVAAPDPRWAASLPGLISPDLRARLGTEDYSREERRNIETGLRLLRNAPEDGSARSLADKAVVHRKGLDALAALAGKPDAGDSSDAFRKHGVIAENLVASGNRLWILSHWQGELKDDRFGGFPGRAVHSHETVLHTFDAKGRVSELRFEADELDVARQAGMPVRVSAETAAKHPIPPLALAANNPPAPPKLTDAQRASLLDDSWPPVWPAIVSDPELQRRIGTRSYTAQERRNIKTALIYISRDRSIPINAEGTGVRRTGMEDLARVTGMKAGAGGGYSAASMPDRQQQLEDIFAKGDEVWVSWRWFGTHKGDWYGAPGTGRPILARESGVFTIRDGRITGAEMRCDELEIAQQLGIPIALNQAK